MNLVTYFFFVEYTEKIDLSRREANFFSVNKQINNLLSIKIAHQKIYENSKKFNPRSSCFCRKYKNFPFYFYAFR